MADFVHLHVHTQYSILDGASNIPVLIKKAVDDGMKAIAITDHGNMFGVKEFHNEAKKQSIKPILGCEVYVAAKSRHDKTDKEDRSNHHLILLAKNATGYKNLSRLVSIGYTEGFYYKPRVDKELLKEFHEGLIATSACIGGEVPFNILTKGIDEGEKSALEYREIFGDDFYLELQRHQIGDPELDKDIFERQQVANKHLIDIAHKHGIKLVATNDVHFINAEDAEAHDRLICLNTNSDLDDPNRLRYTKQEYFKTRREMTDLFADVPEVFESIEEIVEKVEIFELNSNPIMPDFPLPDGFTSEGDYLGHLTYEGAKERYKDIGPEVKERIDFELSVINKMGFPGYFLIVQDFLNAAREMGVSVGPGRGSAAGSVVAYCLKITDIDPLKYNLLFERFLNPDRVSMPDIDIDFDEDGRDLVLKYVVDKYGYSKVAQIITFGTMAAKMAIRDVARIQKLPLPDADRLAKLVPERPGTSLTKAYAEVKELRDAKESGEDLVRDTLRYAEVLEGSVRHTGLHACGIIIGKNDLVNHIPVCTSKDTNLLVTQFDGSHVESVGMLKMDFLGLKTLSIIKDAVKNVKESRGIDIDIENVTLDDAKTYELYSRGETTALFQFESAGMKKYLKELKPNRFEDLIAMNALYRPGPMEYIPSFIARKHGKEKIEYDLPVMEEYLKETYGITVYQEQVMRLSQAMAGFTRGEADSLRKAMGKKIKAMMDQLREKFIAGCVERGLDEEKVKKVWKDWEAFAQYAFNKSHSTCYAYVSYQTAYLKAHYPAEFMAAVLSRNISDIKKITLFMDECRRMGIQVLGPDVNESNYKFTVNKNGDIRFGLGAIKGVGENAVLNIVQERKENGPYKDIYDFVERVILNTVNRKNMEALALAGAFDNFKELKREQFFAMNGKEIPFMDTLIRYGSKVQLEKGSSQPSLFGESTSYDPVKPEIPVTPDWSNLYRLNKEKELIGIYLSAHPLDGFKFEIDHFTNCTLSDLQDLQMHKGREVTIAGIVTEVRHSFTKNNKPYGAFVLEDFTDSFRFVMFGKDYSTFKNFLTEGYSLVIKGKIQSRMFGNDPNELEFKITSINLLTDVRDELLKKFAIKIPVQAIDEFFIDEIEKFTIKSKGKTPLYFIVYDTEEEKPIDVKLFSRSNKVDVSNEFLNFIEKELELEYEVN